MTRSRALREPLRAGLVALRLLPASAEAAETLLDGLLKYLELLQKWGRTYNLTAIHEPERMLTHHLFDSLAMAPFVRPGPLLDVGSGAGLPGIPLALLLPDLRVSLIDASHKKAAFMQQAVIELGLAGRVDVSHGRVEAWPEALQAPRPSAGFTQITARAFADLQDFVRLTQPLLAAEGVWLAMKGLYPHEEIQQLKGVRVMEAHSMEIPGLGAQRHLLVLAPTAAPQTAQPEVVA